MKVVFVTLFFLLIGPARAQVDSVWLEAVEVEAFAFSTFATGAATRILDVGDSTASLAQQLAHVPSVFFKTYGNGQLSSISFRGTSASHTQVLWHGLPSNSPTLGQSDFSLWPVWLLDGLGVQAGSAGALYGSGSIGGTVFIDHFEKSREKPPAAVVHASAGSFGQWFGGVKTRYQRGRWSGGSRLFYSGLENDFPIRLPGTSRIIRQQNAQSLSYGAKQRIQYQGNRQRWSLDAIYVFNDRHIQPSYTSQAVSNTLQSENIRLAMEHVRDMRQGSVTSTVGYLSDQTNYNQGSITTSHQYSFLHRYEYTPAKHFHLQSGIQANQARAVSDHFTGQNTLSNLDVFQSLLWRVQGWSLSGTLRKSFSSRVASPLTFSAGFDHHWKWAEANNLNWTGQFSTGFRVPTLNDLYWVPGGNPLLRPEKSINMETGVRYRYNRGGSTYFVAPHIYHIRANDWILWTPSAATSWSPQNLQTVFVYGASMEMGLGKSISSYSWQQTLQASYTLSLNQSAYPTASSVHAQLPYVPMVLSSWHSACTVGPFSGTLVQAYTGKRYTTLDGLDAYSVAGYYLIDAGASWLFRMDKRSVKASVWSRNLTNARYEIMANHAMPGISFQVEFLIKL